LSSEKGPVKLQQQNFYQWRSPFWTGQCANWLSI